jgi:hypothetical protein
MTELGPSLLELKAELSRAIRQDHQRRQRRRHAVRTGALSVGAFAALSGSALAAGDALGVIDLGGGSSAAPVTIIPVWDGATGTFVNATVGSSATAPYAYHITGGTTTTRCPSTNPPRYQVEPNDIYITSTSRLTAAELQQALDDETEHTAANLPQLRSDGVQSIGVFDNPIGAGCGYGPGNQPSVTPSSSTTQTGPSAGSTTATQPSQTP